MVLRNHKRVQHFLNYPYKLKSHHKTIPLVVLLNFYASFSATGCPITVSSNSTTPINDGARSNCVVTINADVTLQPGTGSRAVSLSGSGSTATNNGIISTLSSFGIFTNLSNTVGSIINTGTIRDTNTGNAIRTSSQGLNTINNSGTLSSTNFHAVYNYSGTVTNFINTGVISGGGSGNSGIKLGGSSNTRISNFTNAGVITSANGFGVYANPIAGVTGTIGTFNNGQGGSSSSASTTALTYFGKLPTTYNIIVKSPTQYGQLSVSSLFSTMYFGIYSGGVPGVAASVLTAGTYSSVFTGVPYDSILGSKSGTYGEYNWSLNNVSGNTWDLVVTGGPAPSSDTNNSSSTSTISNVTSGTTVGMSSIGVTANPVLAGGTIVLSKGERSNQALSILSSGGTIAAPTTGAAQLSGVLSGTGRVTFNGTGMTVVSGANTYTGGTAVESGTLALLGGTLGTGEVYVAPGAQLVGTGSIAGPVTVAGLFKPGNSPGYIGVNANVTMIDGSTYQQDIAGTTRSSQTSPVGATGYYSYLDISGGKFVINSGATLRPALSNLFNEEESGYGSTPYTPVLGDRFRIVTADGGISGRFTTLSQPAELSAGTQFLAFYNVGGSNSIDLALIPTSYKTTIGMLSGNRNAQSVGSALDQMVVASQAGTASASQDQLLYETAGQDAATLVSYAQGISGEVYAASVATIAQTTVRVLQSLLNRLGDTTGISLPSSMTTPTGNTALMANTDALISGGVSNASVSTNPHAEAKTFNNGNVWGDLAYQRTNRSSDSYSGGWSSNLYQLVFGSDIFSENGMKIGGGFALSNTNLNPTYGSATIQQGSIFAYGKMPIQEFVIDGMASIGLSSSDISRGDMTGLSNGFRNKSIIGNDAMVSLGLSRPMDVDRIRITPFARVTWQLVTQSSVNEGDAISALSVKGFTGNGVRGMLGVAAGSKANNPMTDRYTYRAYVGVGADTSGVLNPTLNASLAGINTNITTPKAGSTFVQAGLYGTARIADNAHAYIGLSGEVRTGQTLGVINAGIRFQF